MQKGYFNAILPVDNSDIGLKILNVLPFDKEILLLGPYYTSIFTHLHKDT